MLLMRILAFLLWPIRAPFMLLRRLVRSPTARVAEAAVAGGASKLVKKSTQDDVRYSGVFKIHNVEESDEPRIDDPGVSAAEQIATANTIADKAKRFYTMRMPLFPSQHRKVGGGADRGLMSDFYEEIETAYIEEITSFDNEGGEDQFMRMLKKGRCVANDNARILYCELAPLALALVLAWQWAMLDFDPFQMFRSDAQGLEAYLREGSTGIAMWGVALGVGVLFVTFIYRFSYTHIQRQNAQDLNAFIQIEFARLNDTFRVAHRECLRAETRVDNTQHTAVGPLASAWALSYHWIGVRQLMEEMAIRNAMFQIRRNTSLYVVLGVMICVLVAVVMLAVTVITARFEGVVTALPVALAHMVMLALAFILICYGLTMRGPFRIMASRFRTDEWNRFDTLAVGKAIADQVSNDKLQIVIQRDTRR